MGFGEMGVGEVVEGGERKSGREKEECEEGKEELNLRESMQARRRDKRKI